MSLNEEVKQLKRDQLQITADVLSFQAEVKSTKALVLMTNSSVKRIEDNVTLLVEKMLDINTTIPTKQEIDRREDALNSRIETNRECLQRIKAEATKRMWAVIGIMLTSGFAAVVAVGLKIAELTNSTGALP